MQRANVTDGNIQMNGTTIGANKPLFSIYMEKLYKYTEFVSNGYYEHFISYYRIVWTHKDGRIFERYTYDWQRACTYYANHKYENGIMYTMRDDIILWKHYYSKTRHCYEKIRVNAPLSALTPKKTHEYKNYLENFITEPAEIAAEVRI